MAADAEFLTPSTVFPWLYVFSRFDMQDRVDSCISYIADNKLEIPEECFASVKPKHLQQLHVKLQDILQQELADARHDAKDALMRERTARRECSDAKDRLEAAERKSQVTKLATARHVIRSRCYASSCRVSMSYQ